MSYNCHYYITTVKSLSIKFMAGLNFYKKNPPLYFHNVSALTFAFFIWTKLHPSTSSTLSFHSNSARSPHHHWQNCCWHVLRSVSKPALPEWNSLQNSSHHGQTAVIKRKVGWYHTSAMLVNTHTQKQLILWVLGSFMAFTLGYRQKCKRS